MKNDDVVTINGQKYSASTGLPVAKPVKKSVTQTVKKPTINAVHSITQKARAISKRAASPTSVKPPVRKTGRSMDIAKSKSVSRFAKKDTGTTTVRPKMDVGPTRHPIAANVAKKHQLSKTMVKPVNKPAKQIKEEAIAKALAEESKTTPVKGHPKRHIKFIYVLLIGIAFVLTAAYFTYQNMPSLSVRIASAQAGIEASYPEYVPDGYRPDGPVTYSDNEVTINFRANTGNSKFVIKQSKSSWDSTALKNKVITESKSEYITTEQNGLTIFSYNSNKSASWVNGGVLHSISGNAPLSGEQIRHIATSL